MIKGGSHAENISACETQDRIDRLTRPFLGLARETNNNHSHVFYAFKILNGVIMKCDSGKL